MRKAVISKLRTSVLVAGLALFATSLLAPALVFKPHIRSNPKNTECRYAVQDKIICQSFSFGRSGPTSCELADDKISSKAFVDKQRILDYCKGWDLPVAATDYGYEILLLGFLGSLAWYANPLMLIALLLSMSKKRLSANISVITSVSAIALCLLSYALDAVPFDEGGMDMNYVDHLSSGFYLWMAALAMLSAHCFLRKEESHRAALIDKTMSAEG